MTTGMQIFLDDGTDVQIDDKFFNLALSGKYQVSCSPSFGGPSGSLTISGKSPIVAFSGGYAGVHSISQSGSNFTFYFTVASAVTLTVYVFDVPTSIGNFGLQIFNDDEELTFDSSRLYLKIVKDISFSSYASIQNVPQPVPVPGRAYAILMSQFIGYKFGRPFTPGESGPDFFEVEVNTALCSIDSSNLYLSEFLTFRSQTGLGIQQAWEYEAFAGQIQIIDVTYF